MMKKYVITGAVIFPFLCFMIPVLNCGIVFFFNTLNVLSLGLLKLALGDLPGSHNSIMIGLVVIFIGNAIIGGLLGWGLFLLKAKLNPK